MIKKDYISLGIKAVVITACLAWVFYNSFFGLLLYPGVFFFIVVMEKRDKYIREMSRFDLEFKELLVAISDALGSGYSIENALRDAEDNLLLMFGKEGMLIRDVHELNGKISMRISAEQALLELSEIFPSEELKNFAGVFSFARKLGGEYVKNIRRTVEKMEDKLELKKDIRAVIAEKQMEFKVMCFMPAGILAYVKVTSNDFMDSLYGNLAGAIAMTLCLAVYAGAILLGRKIVDIRV